MNLYTVYAEPCPNCRIPTQPVDIIKDRDGYDCRYHCDTCSTRWEVAYWAPTLRTENGL